MKQQRFLASMAGIVFVVVIAAVFGACNSTSPNDAVLFNVTDLEVGTGAEVVSGNTITVEYTGWLYDASKADHKGLIFDTTTGGNPLVFIVGVGSVIAGWDQGLIGMREGGTRRITIPPSLGYGAYRHGVIPPNATLVFEIKLLKIG